MEEINVKSFTSNELQKALQTNFKEFKKVVSQQSTSWLKQQYSCCVAGIENCNDEIEKINENYYDFMGSEKLHEMESKNIILKNFWESEKEIIRIEIFERAV